MIPLAARCLRLAILALGVSLLHAYYVPSASADLRQDLQSDVLASGFSNVTVAANLVVPATFTFNEDQTSEITWGDLRPFLSANPQLPGAVPSFTLRVAQAPPLKGILQTPDIPGPTYTTLAPVALEAELAAYEAVKHAVTRGENIAGFEYIVEVDGEVATRTYISAPSALTYPSLPLATMPTGEVEEAIRAGLPVWAATEDVSLREDAAGERIVTLSLTRPADAFRVLDVGELDRALAHAQLTLSAEGARIGRVIVRVEDSATGDPLYAAGHDLLYGSRRAIWRSPLVAGFEPISSLTSDLAGQDTVP